MHGRTDLSCRAGIIQVPTYVLLLTHPTCGPGSVPMVGSQLRSHMCVQMQYDARSIRRAACQTDRPSGLRRERDGRAVYSLNVYRRFLDALLHGAGAIHGYKISILYTI